MSTQAFGNLSIWHLSLPNGKNNENFQGSSTISYYELHLKSLVCRFAQLVFLV